MAFYHHIRFQIGAHFYSLHEWEHGIVRGNRRAPHGLQLPLGSQDERKNFAVSYIDGRIHFGLNCGSESCPPIRFFTGHRLLDQELALAAMGFCEDDSNVVIIGNVLYLNKIFHWYRSDFGPGSLPEIVCGFLHTNSPKHQEIRQLLVEKQGNIAVRFLPYDWSSNAVDVKEFRRHELRASRGRRLMRK